MSRKQKKVLIRILVSAALMVVLHFLCIDSILDGWLKFGLYLVPYFIIGYDIILKAIKGIQNRQPFDENFLMTVATIGAIILGRVRSGDYVEGIAVMLFYQIGELFQSIAVGHSRKSISALMDIRPDTAVLWHEDGLHETVDPDDVEIGSIIIVRPGEKIPIDGIVVEGCSSLNTSSLTGESLPVDVEVGSEVLSGCVNITHLLKIKTTKDFGESTASKILDMVENASSLKSRSEAFITRFARIYTPAVCFSALALAIIGPLIRILAGASPDWMEWIMRALTFLVISCPCALVISIPLTFFAGIGGASRSGILVKGSNYLEALAAAETVVFDKTGTVTEGVFEVSGIHHAVIPEDVLLYYAAAAESWSTHPIAQSLRQACNQEIDTSQVENVEEISGMGVIAWVKGKKVAIGNERLMQHIQADYEPCTSVGTVIHVALDDKYCGHILIADKLKPHAHEAIEKLKQSGISQTVMLTGDHAHIAEKIASELHIDRVYADLLPDGKVQKVEELIKEKSNKRTLVFVGDGINDAPVLSRADVGIAMGGIGSDAAIEASDIVLMDDDPLKIAKAIKIAKKCLRIVRENIVFAIGIKLICLVLGAAGIASMWMAIFADVGVMIIAVLNAMRALNSASV